MEDPKENTENTGKEESKEAPPASAQGGETEAPEKEEPTFTKAQVDEEVQKARIKIGWTAAKLEERESAINAREQALEEKEAAEDAKELERFKDDPEKMDIVKERQTIRKEKANIAKERTKLDADLKVVNDAKLEIACFEIAQEQGIKPEDLKEAALELGLKTEEQIKAQAKWMSKGKPEGKEPPKAPPKKPDSGRTTGAAEKTDQQKLDERYPTMKK